MQELARCPDFEGWVYCADCGAKRAALGPRHLDAHGATIDVAHVLPILQMCRSGHSVRKRRGASCSLRIAVRLVRSCTIGTTKLCRKLIATNGQAGQRSRPRLIQITFSFVLRTARRELLGFLALNSLQKKRSVPAAARPWRSFYDATS